MPFKRIKPFLSPLVMFTIVCCGASAAYCADAVSGGAPALSPSDYPSYGIVSPRLTVWVAAQMHLWFAAFVLAVPIFVLIIETVGFFKKDPRYDALAHEFMRVSMTAYTLTAVTGVFFLACLIVFYPQVIGYLASVFRPTLYLYVLFFLAENLTLYVYYYGWARMGAGGKKIAHILIGLTLNLFGTAIMFVANAWVTFMMSPAGVDIKGALEHGVWAAVNNNLWSPMNLHRFIANISYGGAIVGAYAAYKFLSARNIEERAHYDWMGYTSAFISIGALLPLPFAGYWLTAEIYAYSAQMGMNLMGGVFGWLFVIQAVVIGALFLAANYYLWCGLNRTGGGARYSGYVKYIAFVIAVCFMVWFTPHTPVMKAAEVRAVGGQFHPLIAPLGLMPAKNIAVNILIIFTFLSFIFYWRAGRSPAGWRAGRAPSVSWACYGSAAQAAIIAAACVNIIALGVYYGYFTNTVYKVASSVPQVATTIVAITACLVIEAFMHRGVLPPSGVKTQDAGWGRMPDRAQYALFLIAVSFTWLMGLMGFVRAAIRQNWHVYSVMRDSSPEAYTPTIAYAAKVVSLGTISFMAAVIFIFWISSRKGRGAAGDKR